jgi:hypothetical protein
MHHHHIMKPYPNSTSLRTRTQPVGLQVACTANPESGVPFVRMNDANTDALVRQKCTRAFKNGTTSGSALGGFGSSPTDPHVRNSPTYPSSYSRGVFEAHSTSMTIAITYESRCRRLAARGIATRSGIATFPCSDPGKSCFDPRAPGTFPGTFALSRT